MTGKIEILKHSFRVVGQNEFYDTKSFGKQFVKSS